MFQHGIDESSRQVQSVDLFVQSLEGTQTLERQTTRQLSHLLDVLDVFVFRMSIVEYHKCLLLATGHLCLTEQSHGQVVVEQLIDSLLDKAVHLVAA